MSPRARNRNRPCKQKKLFLHSSLIQDTACTSRFEITDVLVHGTEGRTGSDASPLHGAARTGKPLRLHGVARMYGCCLTANRTSILQQNLSHRDPNEPGSARPAVRELHSSTDLHGMPDLDHCTELHGTHAAALQASRGCTSLHGSFLNIYNRIQNLERLLILPLRVFRLSSKPSKIF